MRHLLSSLWMFLAILTVVITFRQPITVMCETVLQDFTLATDLRIKNTKLGLIVACLPDLDAQVRRVVQDPEDQ